MKKKGVRVFLAIACTAGLAVLARADVSASWAQDADGNWSGGANWTGGMAATGTTGVATFNNAITANRTITVDASPWVINGLAFTNTDAFGWTVTGGTLLPAGTIPTVTVSSAGAAKIVSTLAGSSGLTKAGTGTLTLSGPNTFSGGMAISAGTLEIGDGTSSTATAGCGLLAIGVNTLYLNFNGPATLPNSSVIATNIYSAVIQNNGTGKITFTNGLITATIDGGAAGIVLAKTLTSAEGDFRVRGDVTFGSSSRSRTIRSIAPNSTMRIVDDGTFWWVGADSVGYAPTLDIAAGVTVSLASGQGAGSIFYNHLTGPGNFTFDGGNAGQSGTILGVSTLGGTLTANRAVSFGNGGASGIAGGTRIAGTVNGPVTFNSTTDNTYSGEMSGAGALIKTQVNTLTLTGTNTYSGPTVISGGTLAVGGAGRLGAGSYAGDILNNGAFVYNGSAAQTLSGAISGTGGLTQAGAGTLTLAGYNTYAGATHVDTGKLVGQTGGACVDSTVIVADGATHGVQVLAYGLPWTCAGLTFAGGVSALEFDLASFPVSASLAPLQVNGDLTVNGTINVLIRNGFWVSAGTYPLLSYTGALGGSGGFSLAGLPAGVQATLVNNVGAKRVDLNVTIVPAVPGEEGVWTHLDNGNASGSWGASENWSGDIPDGVDAVADFSTLNIGSASYVTNDAPHTVGSLRFADTSASHDWYVTNAAITLATTLGIPTISVANRQVTVSAGLTGTQGFMKDGPGTLALEGLYGNTFSGPIFVGEGVLYVFKGASLKNTSGSITVLSDACLEINHSWDKDGNPLEKPLYLNGNGVGERGAFNIRANLVVNGPIYLQTDSKITFRNEINIGGPITAIGRGINLEFGQRGSLSESEWVLTVTGSINLGTGILTFSSVPGGGTRRGYGLVLSAANTYSGGTVLTDYALLRLGHAAALGSGGVTLAPTTRMDLNTQSITIPWLSGTGGAITDTSSVNGNTTLTITQAIDTVFSGVISNGTNRVIALVKTGVGALTLSGSNTYIGATTVANGILGVGGSLASPSVMIATGSGFSVGATGVVSSASLAGTLVFQDNSRLLVDVRSSLADTVSASGNVAIGNAVELRVNRDPTSAGRWKIIESTSGTLTGNFILVGGTSGSRLTQTNHAVWLAIPAKGSVLHIL